MSLTTDRISQSERSLLEMRSRLTWFERLVSRHANADVLRDLESGVVQQIEGTVDEAFKTRSFNEVHPQYALRLGQDLLVLSGQWLYQPGVNQGAESCFEKWEVNTQFPIKIVVRIAPTSGIAVAFRPLDERTILLNELPVVGPLRIADEARIFPLEDGDVVKTLRKAGVVN